MKNKGRELSAIQSLTEAAGIPEHLEFISELRERHRWGPEEEAELDGQLAEIHRRRQDKNLYLGVIGESSAGKSTFLNAVLRDDLLRVDGLPETTSSVTWMRYNPKLDVLIRYLDGEQHRMGAGGVAGWMRELFSRASHASRKDRLEDLLNRVTTDETIAKNVQDVTLYHPAELLKLGLVIADTPGANAENDRHAQLTSAAVRAHCDTAIVVIPSDAPVSQSLVKFLRGAMSDNLHQCIFLVTKLDRVRERERERLLNTIKQRLQQNLGLRSVTVYGCSPGVVLDELTGDRDQKLSDAQRDAELKTFEQVQGFIWESLQANRERILVERLSTLLSRLMARLPDQLSALRQRVQAQHRALEDNRIQDLRAFATEAKSEHTAQLLRRRTEFQNTTQEACVSAVDKSWDNVVAAVESITSSEDLGKFVESPAGLKQHFERMGSLIHTHYMLQVHEPLSDATRAEIQAFEREFSVLYDKLATLHTGARRLSTGASNHQVLIGNHANSLIQALQGDLNLSAERTMIGAGAGAAIGTFMLPGLGTLIGGYLGGVIGKMFGPDLSELKGKVLNGAHEQFMSVFEQIHSELQENTSAAIDQACYGVEGAIQEYIEEYDHLVRSLIEADQARMRELEQHQHIIDLDIEELKARHNNLQQWRVAMRQILERETDDRPTIDRAETR